MRRLAALALAALLVLTAEIPWAGAEDDSDVDLTSVAERPLDLSARISGASPSREGQRSVEVSVPEFLALQRLAHTDRQRLLGLAPSCQTRMTAVADPSAPQSRLLIVVACAP